MKKNEPYYLALYKEWLQSGKIPDNGLCNVLISDGLFCLLKPDSDVGYWGYDGEPFSSNGFNGSFQEDCKKRRITEATVKYKFTPFRQTIILFLAAMNNEL